MRPTIAVTLLLILAAEIGVGWKDHLRLVQIRSKHDRLATRAAERGVVFAPGDPIPVTKRPRDENNNRVRLAREKFTSFAIALEAHDAERAPAGLEFQKQSAEFLASMASLDADEFRMLLSDALESKDMSDDTRGRLIGAGLRTLAHDNPRTALAVLTESSDLIGIPFLAENLVSDVLESWAKTCPDTALEWFSKNTGKYPDILTDDVASCLIAGVSVQDPNLALQLIDRFGITDSARAIRGMASAPSSAGERTATLEALRRYFANKPDREASIETRVQAARILAREARNEGFKAASEWISGASFTDAELSVIAADLYDIEKNNSGQWIEWIGKALPENTARDRIWHLFSGWTDNNPRAAGEWLAAAPDGLAKYTAARAYAEKVFPYDRETAIRWALSVPAGEDRDRTLQRLHDAWPKDDPEGAAAFANEHGIK